MEAAGSSETLLTAYNIIWFHNPENRNLNITNAFSLCSVNISVYICGKFNSFRIDLYAEKCASIHAANWQKQSAAGHSTPFIVKMCLIPSKKNYLIRILLGGCCKNWDILFHNIVTCRLRAEIVEPKPGHVQSISAKCHYRVTSCTRLEMKRLLGNECMVHRGYVFVKHRSGTSIGASWQL
jgi:hypothetical protein